MIQRYVLDASVMVKILHQEREQDADKACAIVAQSIAGIVDLYTSDFASHEVFNALIRGKGVTGVLLQRAVEQWFLLPIERVETDLTIALKAADIAQQHAITFYDAVYMALAFDRGIPLITANPKHQKSTGGIQVIPLNEWLS